MNITKRGGKVDMNLDFLLSSNPLRLSLIYAWDIHGYVFLFVVKCNKILGFKS